MEEFRKPSKPTVVYPRDPRERQRSVSASKRREAWKEMRRVIEERRNVSEQINQAEDQDKSEEDQEDQEDQEEDQEESPRVTQGKKVEMDNSPILQSALNAEKTREREYNKIEKAISPASNYPSTTSSHENGWKQTDGRRAEYLVIYGGKIPESIRRRIEPAKITHFRFRNSSDQKAFLEAISSPSHTAVYQENGKKDVTITSSSGELIGNIHFLHMDQPDIHNPEKYYVKFYLLDFIDSNTLRTVKQNIHKFFDTISSLRKGHKEESHKEDDDQEKSSQLSRISRAVSKMKRRSIKTRKSSHFHKKPYKKYVKHTRRKKRYTKL